MSSISEINVFTQGIVDSDSELDSWFSSAKVNDDGSFRHSLNVESVLSKDIWSDFSLLASNIVSGQHRRITAGDLYSIRSWLANADLNIAAQINEFVAPLNAEFDSFKTAVATKDPNAVQSSFTTDNDKKVILGLLLLIKFQLINNPDPEAEKQLNETASSLIKIFKGQKLLKEDLIKLEPNLESLGIKLFPSETSNDIAVDNVKKGQQSLQEARDLHSRQLT